MLPVASLTPFTTIDYPGHLAAVIFTQGCPLRCRYCHNQRLLPFTAGAVPWAAVRAFLADRQGWLEAVVFSGGEPTAHPSLPAALADVKTLGYKIGLHSSGYYPENFAAALPLTDWVGLDLKAPFGARYDHLTRARRVSAPVQQSLAALLASGKDYQLRLTFDPAFHRADDAATINQMLAQHSARPLTVQPLNELNHQPFYNENKCTTKTRRHDD